MNNVDTDIYWLAMSPGQKTDEKLLLLKENQYKVIRSDSLKEFQEAFNVSPSENTVIIISEEIFTPVTENTIQMMFQDPAYDGARMIYCCGNFENNSAVKAIECGAKDIIPLFTTNLRWLNKFRFSVGSQSSKFPRADFGVALKEKAKLELPSRIVWVNEDFICINTDYCPDIGDQISLHNKHHNQIDLTAYKFKVVKTHSNYLTYRYSNAIICEWTGKDDMAEKEKSRYIARLKDTCHPLRQNIYLGIYSKKIRRRLINKFDKIKFHVHCSSNILRMLDEIKYLQPEIILLDGRAFSKARTLIPKIRSTAGKKVHIYIFGLKLSAELKEKLNKKYNIHCFEKIPLLIENSINKKALVHLDTKDDIKYELDADHPFSSVSIRTKAIIEKWDSKQIRINTNRKLGNYAMLNISSPSIGNTFPSGIWSKVSHTKLSDGQNMSATPFASDVLFSSPTTSEILKISKAILKSFSKVILDTIDESQVRAIYEERAEAANEIIMPVAMQKEEEDDDDKDLYIEPKPKNLLDFLSKMTDFYHKRKSEMRLFLILAIFVALVFYAISNYKEMNQQKNQKFRRGFESLLK